MAITDEEWNTMHIGRSWPPDHPIEDECSCPQSPCGLIQRNEIDPDCMQHGPQAAKTFRSSHLASECPG